MFVYAFFSSDGHNVVQGFHKQEKAAEFAITSIAGLISNDERSYNKKDRYAYAVAAVVDNDLVDNVVDDVRGEEKEKPKPPTLPDELVKAKSQLERCTKEKTVDNAVKLIELYEEYLKHVIGKESALHTIKDVRIVE